MPGSIRGRTRDWQVKLCDLLLTRAIPERLGKALYKCPVYFTFEYNGNGAT